MVIITSTKGSTMTNTQARRLGAYHHGQETKVIAARIQVSTYERFKRQQERAGRTVAEGVEYLIETQALRNR